MKDLFCMGAVQFPRGPVDWDSVVLACDLIISSGAQVVFGRSKTENNATTLPFAAKSSAEALLKEVFDGCHIVCAPLRISFADKKALQVATRISAINPKKDRVSLSAIKPKSEICQLDRGIIGRDRQLEKIKSIVEVIGAYGRNAVESLHMMFVGPPGVGKTMVAQSLLELYDRKGVTSGRGIFVNASASDLVSQYVGETSHFVQKMFDKADGGILFIDEAYRLSRQCAAVDGTSHGQEAIDAINQLMEERRNDVIVILAGYPEEMEGFLKHNPGLKGRIGFEIEFEGYGEGDLLSIFGQMAKDRGFEVSRDALDALENRIHTLSKQAGFANARTMRKLLDHTVANKAKGQLDWRLNACDVQRALDDREFRAVEKLPVGFTV